MTLIERALAFATERHAGQLRKYSNDPYIIHPMAVAELVRATGAADEVVAAALLHDVLEDTGTAYSELAEAFGERVADLVVELTNTTTRADGNRAKRKGMDRDRLATVSADAQTIKLADLIDNTKSIVEKDPKFAKVYLIEKRALVDVLTKGHPDLRAMAEEHV